MAPPTPKRWTTDPEYIELLNYLIRRTENVESPMSIKRLAIEFKEKSGALQTNACLKRRIEKMRTMIHSFDHIDTNTKVKLIFALSVPVDASFLRRLNKNALVKVDEKKRITHYKATNGCLELRGDHSRSVKISAGRLESKGSFRSMIINYFETKGDADAIPKNKKEKKMANLIEFITENCVNVDIPLSIDQLAKDFNSRFGISIPLSTIQTRVKGYCRDIQKVGFLDTHTKVQQLFSLSATVDSDCLKELRKDAIVEIDEKNRITYYKATNGSLELRGDHHLSAKMKTAMIESKGSIRSMINSYFENKNYADSVPSNKSESEMWQLIEFITEKCQSVDSPLSICKLTKNFIQNFESSVPLKTVRYRIEGYRREIQTLEFLGTHSKVKQLFCLSAKLDSNILKELRKDAVVEVDNRNRITKYTANDGHLTLRGNHSRYAKTKLAGIEGRKRKNTVMKHSNSGCDKSKESEKENGYSEDDSDEYSSEEFGSEFDSDDESDHLDEQDHMNSSNEVFGFDNETAARNRSPTEMSIDDNLDFDSLTEKSRRSEETEMGGDEKNDPKIIGNTSVKTRYGRLSKRRHLDSEFSYDLASSRSSEAPASFESAPAKQKKIAIEKEQASSSSNQIRSSSRSIRIHPSDSTFPSFSTESGENIENQDDLRTEDNPSDCHIPRIQEMEDYDYNPREANTPQSSSIDNRLREPEPSAAEDPNLNNDTQNTDNRSDAAAPKIDSKKESLAHQNVTNSTPQTNGKEVNSQEVPIKIENGEPIIVEDHPEDVKPVTTHNFKIKFFEAMKSLILFLDTPSLSNLQSKINQKIRIMRGSKEVLQNNELIPSLELMIARMTNHSVIDISKGVESVSLIQFFCYLKASLLNSKMIGVEGLMNYISGLIEKSQNKRITMVKVADALRATVDIDSF